MKAQRADIMTNLIKPTTIKAIYDNSKTKQPTLDCMTFVLDSKPKATGMRECLGTSYNGAAFSQYAMCQVGKHLGRKVTWDDLSDELKKHVITRLS